MVKISEISRTSSDNYLISPESIVIVEGKSIGSNKSSKEIKKILYGNQFGVKTIR